MAFLTPFGTARGLARLVLLLFNGVLPSAVCSYFFFLENALLEPKTILNLKPTRRSAETSNEKRR
jgi:hypothetical protein